MMSYARKFTEQWHSTDPLPARLRGLAAGAIVLNNQGGFSVIGPWRMRILRFSIGLIVVFLFWYGLGAVFPRGDFLLSYILRYLRHILVGVWITGFASMTFFWLGLAETNIRRKRAITPDVL